MGQRLKVLAIIVCLMPFPALAVQESASPQSTAISNGDRYQIVQSELAAKWTFRLDRVCGSVGQLVTTADSGIAWQRMDIEALPACVLDGKPHYQLFTSGLAARHTFLMNTATGKTWVLLSDKEGGALWSTFAP